MEQNLFRAYKACLTVAAYYNMFNFLQGETGGGLGFCRLSLHDSFTGVR